MTASLVATGLASRKKAQTAQKQADDSLPFCDS
jgi:hypothetical protein